MVAMQHETLGRERILVAARALFAEQGFHQTSMAELAALAKVSVGQIYRLFKGKEDIIAAIVDDDKRVRLDGMMALCARLKAGEISIEETFEQLVLSAMSQKSEALSFDILAEAFRNPVVGATITSLCVRYKMLLREFACMANPALSSEALDGAEEMLLACLFGLGHRSLSRPALNASSTASHTARIILAGLQGANGKGAAH
ncbi:helix-turn-helix domain-containing protein [Sphingobium sp. AN641]|uniref:TetR/AcrR family transcriptional regulator n=1 Tax=Sphingobium sp. AN641 TaxID=3133443 RepID=UPI0030C0B7C0